MEHKIGDLVTRKSYNNDIVFTITDIIDDVYYLKGESIRLYADAYVDDLNKYNEVLENDDEEILNRIKKNTNLNRDDYFYLPGKILHIDGDRDYLDRCIKYYNSLHLQAIGKIINEEEAPYKIVEWLEEYKPNIVVITGHDAYYKKNGSIHNISAYKNSENFIKSVNQARTYEKNHDNLIIIAGACQSNYEDLIKAGATFASSPKRVNIHALDPAIIASELALSDINKDIDLKKILENTKYGASGIGGIMTKGTMYIGYPR